MRNRATWLLVATTAVTLLLLAIIHAHCQAAYVPVTWHQMSLPRNGGFLEQRSLQHASLDSANPRIVGGRPAGRHPYFAIPASSMLCGSTLIHPDILLSAAHCAGVFLAGAYIGITNLNGDGATFVEVENEIVHPEFDKAKFLNDIMLIKLRDSVPHPIVELNSDRDVPRAGQLVTAVGLGDTIGRNYFSQELMEVLLPVQKHKKCMRHFGGIDDDTMICAGGERGMDACSGDSGGPLLTPNGAQVGIVSFGDGCGQPGVPAVYTRISAYRRWIDESLCKHSRHPPTDCKQGDAAVPSEWEEVISSFLAASTTAAPQTKIPTKGPTRQPSSVPSNNPSEPPSRPTSTEPPSHQPTDIPTIYKSPAPSDASSNTPSNAPSNAPSDAPSNAPWSIPSKFPSEKPTTSPSDRPSGFPSERTTQSPSLRQTNGHFAKLPPRTSSAPQTTAPSSIPSQIDTGSPTTSPSALREPTPGPSPLRPPTEGPTSSPLTIHPTTGGPTPSPSTAKMTAPTESPIKSAWEPTSRPTASESLAELPRITPPTTDENSTLQSGQNSHCAGSVLLTDESREIRCKEQASPNFPVSIQQFIASAFDDLASASPPTTPPSFNQDEVTYNGAANLEHEVSSSSSQKVKSQKMKMKKNKWQKRRGMNRAYGRNGNTHRRRRMSSP